MAEAVAEKKLKLRVIAPTMSTDKSPYKFEKAVDMVIVRCITGDMGILPGRVPVSMVLGTGVLRIFDEDSERHIALVGGVAHVSDDVVTILSDEAQKPDEIDVDKVNADLREFRQMYEQATDLKEKKKYSDESHRCQVLLEVAKSK